MLGCENKIDKSRIRPYGKMFNFMGKKEKKSRSKGSSSAGGEELENVDKLEEVRRSLKIRSGKRKEKTKLPSGITADYSSAFFAQLDVDRGSELDRGNEEVISGNTTTVIDLNNGDVYERHHQFTTSAASNSMVSATFISHSDNSSDNSINFQPTKPTNLPPVPPRIPKRGILKGSKASLLNISDSDSRAVLMRNTLQNERLSDEVRKLLESKSPVGSDDYLFSFRFPSTINYRRISMWVNII